MNKTFNVNDKNFQDVSVAVFNDIMASNPELNSMDDLYRTACKYVNLTREQFDEFYKQAEEHHEDWKKAVSMNSSSCELNEEELEDVVGGGIIDFVKEHAETIGVLVGCAILFGALGAGLGAAIGGLMTTGAVVGGVTMGATTSSLVIGGVIGGVVGAAAGVGIGLYKME